MKKASSSNAQQEMEWETGINSQQCQQQHPDHLFPQCFVDMAKAGGTGDLQPGNLRQGLAAPRWDRLSAIPTSMYIWVPSCHRGGDKRD